VRLNHIRDFVAVIQAGSLRAAARALNVSQPGISKSLRQLEAELGVQLLQRNGRGAVATSAGKAFLSRARVVQAELRKVIEDLEPFQGGSQGRVAFGIAPQLSMLMVPQALQQFRQRYPHARLRIVEGVATALLPAVREYAKLIATTVSPRSIGVMKKQVWDAQFQTLAESIVVGDAEMKDSFLSEDFKEGVAHFMEKRAPKFSGR